MQPNDETIILVNENNQEIGFESKLKTHQQGLLHRAFSIFIFKKNENGEFALLLQERAHDKYHSGGLWTNTCCSHPREGETLEVATQRRLREEFGFECELTYIDAFIYKAKIGDLIEHEYDHVYVGIYKNQLIIPNTKEISTYKWMSLTSIKIDQKKHPKRYTAWFKESFEIALKALKNNP